MRVLKAIEDIVFRLELIDFIFKCIESNFDESEEILKNANESRRTLREFDSGFQRISWKKWNEEGKSLKNLEESRKILENLNHNLSQQF